MQGFVRFLPILIAAVFPTLGNAQFVSKPGTPVLGPSTEIVSPAYGVLCFRGRNSSNTACWSQCFSDDPKSDQPLVCVQWFDLAHCADLDQGEESADFGSCRETVSNGACSVSCSSPRGPLCAGDCEFQT